MAQFSGTTLPDWSGKEAVYNGAEHVFPPNYLPLALGVPGQQLMCGSLSPPETTC